MEEARWAYWRELTGDFPHDRLPGLILARAECDFIRPVQSRRAHRHLAGHDEDRPHQHVARLRDARRARRRRSRRARRVMVTYDYSSAEAGARARLGPHAHRGIRRAPISVARAHDPSRTTSPNSSKASATSPRSTTSTSPFPGARWSRSSGRPAPASRRC